MLGHCRRSAKKETGGIVIGHYNARHTCAICQRVTGPPGDSVHVAARFLRGVSGLQKLLNRMWQRQQEYYLGEWHYHPFAAPAPSPSDVMQMLSIAEDPNYSCPEPILIIVGGDPDGKWQPSATVYAKAQLVVPLIPRP